MSASRSGVMICVDSTSGVATVAFQSLSSSPTATWNSSSRLPRGSSMKASMAPVATGVRISTAPCRKWSQCETAIRRAVGTRRRSLASTCSVSTPDTGWSTTSSATGMPSATIVPSSCFAASGVLVGMTAYSPL